eukprot:2019823-Prymnesium_polylepis.1
MRVGLLSACAQCRRGRERGAPRRRLWHLLFVRGRHDAAGAAACGHLQPDRHRAQGRPVWRRASLVVIACALAHPSQAADKSLDCLLYTSDAADDM